MHLFQCSEHILNVLREHTQNAWERWKGRWEKYNSDNCNLWGPAIKNLFDERDVKIAFNFGGEVCVLRPGRVLHRRKSKDINLHWFQYYLCGFYQSSSHEKDNFWGAVRKNVFFIASQGLAFIIFLTYSLLTYNNVCMWMWSFINRTTTNIQIVSHIANAWCLFRVSQKKKNASFQSVMTCVDRA